MPEAAAHVGAPLRANLTILNDSDAPLRVELPAALHARLETRAIRRDGSTSRPIAAVRWKFAPRQFLKVALRGTVPEGAADDSNADADRPRDESRRGADRAARHVIERGVERSLAPASASGTALIDKPPPLAVSVYEPVYLLSAAMAA